MGSKRAQEKRLARIKAQTPPDADHEKIRLIYQCARLLTKLAEYGLVFCATTGKIFSGKFVVDHIIPLAKKGRHHHDNMQILTEEMNDRKGDKYPWTPANFGFASYGVLVIKTGAEKAPLVIRVLDPDFAAKVEEISLNLMEAFNNHTGASLDLPITDLIEKALHTIGIQNYTLVTDMSESALVHAVEAADTSHIISLIDTDAPSNIVTAFKACGEWLLRDMPASIGHASADMMASFGHAAEGLLGSLHPVIEAIAPALEWGLTIAEHLLF